MVDVKPLMWSEDNEFAYGLACHYSSESEFIENVKSQYDDGESGGCEVLDMSIQPCIWTQKPIPADSVIALVLVDATIENYYVAKIKPKGE